MTMERMENNAQLLEQYAGFLERLINSIMAGLYGLAICVFIGLVLLMFAARSHFHPLFCLLFTLVIICYIICNVLTVALMLMNVTNCGTPQSYAIINAVFPAVYVYLSCMLTFCVLERFFATVFPKNYELRRNWFVLLSLQAIAVVIVVVHSRFDLFGGIVSDLVLLALYCVILVSLATLLMINRRMQASTRGKRSLSFRYQVSENVRALRLITPLVLFDTSVTIADMVAFLWFNVSRAFDADNYKSSPNYLPAYIVLRTAAVVLQYGIAAVMLRHETLRRIAYSTLSKLAGRPICANVDRVDCIGRVAYVENVNRERDDPAAVYFNYLRNQWTK
ncbi:hypothetical protein GCK32_010042 [Trichostrongylus colubriformis]|uniref:Uncharacterized protein n=1 Tax=Trichostrongylus colubriformis TaxID=6319 RepID=A0AAN8F3F2_TRICO